MMHRAPTISSAPASELRSNPAGGLGRAFAVLGTWCVCTIVLTLGAGGLPLPMFAIMLGAALMTWLYTGLFITAHDAIHGLVWPGNRRGNDLIGRVCLALFAAFPWRPMVREHRLHHREPGSARDPDFHDGQHATFLRWYLRFVWHYVRWPQIVIMAVVFNVLSHLVGVEEWRLLAFWVAPSLLSTLQLFTFGTYLPHRSPVSGWRDAHRSASSELPRPLSLLSCFHFGLHWEHHQWPHVPWWLLPQARAIRRALDEGGSALQPVSSDSVVGEHV